MSKRRQSPQSATSLDVAPEDDGRARERHYLITMGVRTACFALTIFVTPYGWYTFVFAAAAIFLPMIAVAFANTRSAQQVGQAESPQSPAIETGEPAPEEDDPDLFVISETVVDEKDARPEPQEGAPEDDGAPDEDAP